MKDVKGFCRLFDINVPSFKEIDYYLDQLSKTEKYKNIKDLANLYEENENQFGDLYQIRTEKSKSLIDFLSISDAYTEMTFDLIVDLPTSKEFKPEENKKYFSVDIVQANWQALKRYDHFNKLGNSYPEFFEKFWISRGIDTFKIFKTIYLWKSKSKKAAKGSKDNHSRNS